MPTNLTSKNSSSHHQGALVPFRRRDESKDKHQEASSSSSALIVSHESSLVPSRPCCPYCQRPFFFSENELLVMLQQLDEVQARQGDGPIPAASHTSHRHHHPASGSPTNGIEHLEENDDDIISNNNNHTLVDPNSTPNKQRLQRQQTKNDPLHVNHLSPVTNITPEFFESTYKEIISRRERRRLEMLTPMLRPKSPGAGASDSSPESISSSFVDDGSNSTHHQMLPPAIEPVSSHSTPVKNTSFALITSPLSSIDKDTLIATNNNSDLNSSPKSLLVLKDNHDDSQHHHKSAFEERPSASSIDADTTKPLDEIQEQKQEDQQQQPGSPSSASSPPPPSFYTYFFEEVALLGRGSFGSVSLCRHVIEGETLGLYACKRVPVGDSNPQFLHRALAEVRILQSIRRHPNCTQYFYSWVEMAKLCDYGPKVRCLFILQEFADMGTLDSFMEKNFDNYLPDDAVWCFFLMALDGLTHLHSQGLLHRDIKVENMLLTKQNDVVVTNHHHNTRSSATSSALPHERPPIQLWPRLMLADFGTSALIEQKQKLELVLSSSSTGAAKATCDDETAKIISADAGALVAITSSPTHNEHASAVTEQTRVINSFLATERLKRRKSSSALDVKAPAQKEEIPNTARANSDKDNSNNNDTDDIPTSLPPQARSGATGTEDFMAPELSIFESDDEEEDGNNKKQSGEQQDKTQKEEDSTTETERKYKYSHSVQSDLYSLGVCLHYMAFEGTLPIMRRKCRLNACRTKRPAEMIQLIEVLLQPNPLHRPESCETILQEPFCIKLKQRLGMLYRDSSSSHHPPRPTNHNNNSKTMMKEDKNHHLADGHSVTTSSVLQSQNQQQQDDDDDHIVDVLSGTYGSAKDLREFYKEARKQNHVNKIVNNNNSNTVLNQDEPSHIEVDVDEEKEGDQNNNSTTTNHKSRKRVSILQSSPSPLQKSSSLFDVLVKDDDEDRQGIMMSSQFGARYLSPSNSREREQKEKFPENKTTMTSSTIDDGKRRSESSSMLLKVSLISNIVLVGVGAFVLFGSGKK